MSKSATNQSVLGDASHISHRSQIRRVKWFAALGVLLFLFLGAFTTGVFVQWNYSVAGIIGDYLPSSIASFIVSNIGTRTGTGQHLRIDPILAEITAQPPRYTYDGDYHSFKENFKKYKYESIGFPIQAHRSFMLSSKVGDINILDQLVKGDIEVFRMDFSVVGGRLPGLFVRNSNASEKKIVIVIPGHPSGDDPLDDLVNEHSYQKGIALQLARHGYTVFAMGLRGFNTSSLRSHDFQAIASMKQYSWYGFLTSDALLLRKHVAAKYRYPEDKIGFVGLSSGGAVSMFAAALADDVPYAIICGFFGSFSHNFVYENHSRSGNIAGVLNYFEMRDFLIATAPRVVVVVNGEHDTFSATHATSEFMKAQRVYEQLGEEQKAKIFTPGSIGHEYDVDLVVKTLARIQQW